MIRRCSAAQQGLSHIRQSTLQLEQTVSMLLALAREQALPATGEANRLLPVIERVIVEQSPLLDDKQIQLDIDVAFAESSTRCRWQSCRYCSPT